MCILFFQTAKMLFSLLKIIENKYILYFITKKKFLFYRKALNMCILFFQTAKILYSLLKIIENKYILYFITKKKGFYSIKKH